MDAAVTHPIADCAPQPVWMDKRRTPSHLSATGSAGALLALLLGYYWWFLPPAHPISQPTHRIASRLSRHAWSVSSHSLTRLFVWCGRWVLPVAAGAIIRRVCCWAASCTSTSGPPNQTGTQPHCF
eukprot:3123456-Prymnesium_polylepis.2